MATNPIRRIVKPDIDVEDKIPIFAFFLDFQQWMDGDLTGPNFRTPYGMDASDLSSGQIGQLRDMIVNAAMSYERQRIALWDIAAIALRSESDDDTRGHATNAPAFLAAAQAAVDRVKNAP